MKPDTPTLAERLRYTVNLPNGGWRYRPNVGQEVTIRTDVWAAHVKDCREAAAALSPSLPGEEVLSPTDDAWWSGYRKGKAHARRLLASPQGAKEPREALAERIARELFEEYGEPGSMFYVEEYADVVGRILRLAAPSSPVRPVSEEVRALLDRWAARAHQLTGMGSSSADTTARTLLACCDDLSDTLLGTAGDTSPGPAAVPSVPVEREPVAWVVQAVDGSRGRWVVWSEEDAEAYRVMGRYAVKPCYEVQGDKELRMLLARVYAPAESRSEEVEAQEMCRKPGCGASKGRCADWDCPEGDFVRRYEGRATPAEPREEPWHMKPCERCGKTPLPQTFGDTGCICSPAPAEREGEVEHG